MTAAIRMRFNKTSIVMPRLLAHSRTAAALLSRRGRDERYLGITPGLEPGMGQEHTVSRVGRPNVVRK